LIEDNVGDVVLIHDAVKRLPVPVNLHLALDGHQALLVLSNPHFQPDLIVLDLNIPKIPGTELLPYGRAIERRWWFLSSSSNPAERDFCLASGAQEFVTKPVELDEFQNAVRRIVERWGVESGFGTSLRRGVRQ
jgi:CheY-like chemotaxis protein